MPKRELRRNTPFGIERVADMHYLYILKSRNSGKYYIGETNNIENRLQRHRQKKTSFGQRNDDLILIYKKELNSRSEAKKLEYFLRKQKSHLFIDKFLAGKVIPP